MWGVYTGGKYLGKKLGVKEGGGRLLEGGVFLGAYGRYVIHLAYVLSVRF